MSSPSFGNFHVFYHGWGGGAMSIWLFIVFADRYRQKVENRYVDASRFEGLTKELYVQVAVSKHTFDVSGLMAGEGMALQMMEVPGFSQTTAVYTSRRAIDLPEYNAQSM
jgi:hypothetical protein